MKNSKRNLRVIENFILHLTHSSRGETNNPLYKKQFHLTPEEIYVVADEYIEEDHVDGKGNPEDDIVLSFGDRFENLKTELFEAIIKRVSELILNGEKIELPEDIYDEKENNLSHIDTENVYFQSTFNDGLMEYQIYDLDFEVANRIWEEIK